MLWTLILFFTVASHHLKSAKVSRARSDTCQDKGRQLGNMHNFHQTPAFVESSSQLEGPQAFYQSAF